MINLNKDLTIYKTCFLWLIATTVGWGVIGYIGFENRDLILSSWNIVFQITVKVFINGLLIGSMIGILQILLISNFINLKKSWVLVQACSYALGSALGVLSIISFIWLGSPALFTSPEFIFPIPLSFIMLMSGGVIGFLQVLGLKFNFAIRNINIILYLMFSSVSFGISFFLVGILNTSTMNLIQSSLAGTVIGLITGFALYILIKDEIKQKTLN